MKRLFIAVLFLAVGSAWAQHTEVTVEDNQTVTGVKTFTGASPSISSSGVEALAGSTSYSGFGCQNGSLFNVNSQPNCVSVGASAVSGNNVPSQALSFFFTNGSGTSVASSLYVDNNAFLNLVQPATTPNLKIGGGASGPFIIASQFCLSTTLCWLSGSGVPGGSACTTATAGSLYSRTDQVSDTVHQFYVCTNNGGVAAWTPK